MKRLYWGVGLILVMLICLWQWKTEPQAAGRLSSGVTIYYYKLDEVRGHYQIDRSETIHYEARLYAPFSVHLEPTQGYIIEYFTMNAGTHRYFMTQDIILTMQHSEVIRIYERPIPSYAQTTTYEYYDAARKRWQNYSTHTDYIREGERYSYTFEKPPYSYWHVGDVQKNGSYSGNFSNISYTVTGATNIKVRWYPSVTYVYFHPEGGTGTMQSQSGYYGGNITLNANRFVKPGFRFVGWKGKMSGSEKTFFNGETFRVQSRVNGERIDLYAQWEPIFEKMFLKYMDTMKLENDAVSDSLQWENQCMFPVLDANEKGTFLGWSPSVKDGKPLYTEKSIVKAGELYEWGEKNKTLFWEGKNVMMPLYSVWDRIPKLVMSTVYVPETWAKEGKISLEFIKQFIKSVDEEDGILPEKNIRVEGFDPERIKEAHGGEEIRLVVKAYDKLKNCVEGELKVCIVATNEKSLGRRGRVRFIDASHIDTLSENSVWRVDDKFASLLQNVLDLRK
ncbi:repeat domain (List_Bact_rpt) [Lachnospiraceae bacterium XBB1006]|nr:repeat domain (List_Bact_rpt) [Lachnospiraceae bacterium XBB1006]